MDGIAFYMIFIVVVLLVLWRRTRSMYRPVRGNGIRLLIPIIIIFPAMSMLTNLPVDLPMWALGAALGVGVVFSIPLIWTTNYEVREDQQIYAKKNWGFVVAFIGIVIIRVVLRQELSGMAPEELGALVMVTAVGYIVPWRVVSFLKFRRVAGTQRMQA